MSTQDKIRKTLTIFTAVAVFLLPASLCWGQYAPLYGETQASVDEEGGGGESEHMYDEDWFHAYAHSDAHSTDLESYAWAIAESKVDANGISTREEGGSWAADGDEAYWWAEAGYRLPMLVDGPGDPGDYVAITVDFNDVELACPNDPDYRTKVALSFQINGSIQIADGEATLSGDGDLILSGVYDSPGDWSVNLGTDGYWRAKFTAPSLTIPESLPIKVEFDCDYSTSLSGQIEPDPTMTTPRSVHEIELTLDEGYSFDVLEPEPCEADVNGDGMVDVLDLLVILGAWGPCL